MQVDPLHSLGLVDVRRLPGVVGATGNEKQILASVVPTDGWSETSGMTLRGLRQPDSRPQNEYAANAIAASPSNASNGFAAGLSPKSASLAERRLVSSSACLMSYGAPTALTPILGLRCTTLLDPTLACWLPYSDNRWLSGSSRIESIRSPNRCRYGGRRRSRRVQHQHVDT
jgi:hypothetical protein